QKRTDKGIAEKLLLRHVRNPSGKGTSQQHRVNQVNMIGDHDKRTNRGDILPPPNLPGEKDPVEESENGSNDLLGPGHRFTARRTSF
ncbi:unnamed protein product, partial [marine sediment metagenome]